MLDTRDLSAEKTRSCSKESGVTAGTFSETARFGELLVLSVLGRVVDQVVKLAGAENFEGKTVIDTTSPLSEDPQSTEFCSTRSDLTSRLESATRRSCQSSSRESI